MPAPPARLMRFCLPNASLLLLALIAAPLYARAPEQVTDRRAQADIDESLRREGEAVIALADLAMNAKGHPSDFGLEWRNDFLKAQPGTFVPFTITVDTALRATAALMYVRIVTRETPLDRRRGAPPYAYETILPIEMEASRSQPLRVRRGFAVAPGRYTAFVVVRERAAQNRGRREPPPKASVLVQELDVPDFWTGELSASTVMLAERVEPLTAPVPCAARGRPVCRWNQ